MIRIHYQLRHAIMGMLGSFWSRVVSPRSRVAARSLATSSAHAESLQQMVVPANKLVSSRRAAVECVVVPYLEGEFAYIGPELAKFWRHELGTTAGSTFEIVRQDVTDAAPKGAVLLLDSYGNPLGQGLGSLLTVRSAEAGLTGSDPLYVVPLPLDLTPVVIATRHPDRVLVQGIDFEVGAGHIVMRESPGDLFGAGGFTVLHGSVELPLPYNFTMQLNGSSFGHSFVAAYYRGSGSRSSFERAAAQAAGLLVLEVDDTLLWRQPLPDGVTRYIFRRAGPVDVGYPHDPLTPGNAYSRGFVVSAGFRVVGSGPAGWFRRAVRSRHCCLDGAMPVGGLYLPPTDVMVDYEDVSLSGSAHARVWLAGIYPQRVAWWRAQKDHENLHGVFLADIIGLSPGSPAKQVDFHAMMEVFFGTKLLVVVPAMDAYPPEYLKRLEEFVAREKPMGSAVVCVKDPPVVNSDPVWIDGGPVWVDGVPVVMTELPE